MNSIEETQAHRRELSRIAKAEMLAFIKTHGAHGSIQALADALAALGPEWQGDDGAAVSVEAVTGHAPWRGDDYRGAVP